MRDGDEEHKGDLETFKINNTSNIMVILCEDEWDSKVIVETFLQANVSARTKYKCCVLHNCVRENKITQDPYYIVKNIIFSILKKVPSLENFIKLHDPQCMKEML